MRSATGSVTRPVVVVPMLSVLGVERTDFPVVAHEFPDDVRADGLLGLDFFAGHVLTLDFARGRVSLWSPRRRWWPFGR